MLASIHSNLISTELFSQDMVCVVQSAARGRSFLLKAREFNEIEFNCGTFDLENLKVSFICRGKNVRKKFAHKKSIFAGDGLLRMGNQSFHIKLARSHTQNSDSKQFIFESRATICLTASRPTPPSKISHIVFFSGSLSLSLPSPPSGFMFSTPNTTLNIISTSDTIKI